MERYSHLCPIQALIAKENDLRAALAVLTVIVHYRSRIGEFMRAMKNEQRLMEQELAQLKEDINRFRLNVQKPLSDDQKVESRANQRRLAAFRERMQRFVRFEKHLPTVEYIAAYLDVLKKAVDETLVL